MYHGFHIVYIVVSALRTVHVVLVDVYKLLDASIFTLVVLYIQLDLLLVRQFVAWAKKDLLH